MAQKTHIVVAGNPVNGFRFLGPMSPDQADKYANSAEDDTFWAVELIPVAFPEPAPTPVKPEPDTFEMRPCRTDKGGDVEECEVQEAEFFGIYRRSLDSHGDKLATWVADFPDQRTAEVAAAFMRMSTGFSWEHAIEVKP